MANELAPSNLDPTLGGYTPGQGPVASQSAPLAPAKDTKPKAEAPPPKPDKGNVIPFPGRDTGSGGAEAAMAAIGRLEHERQNTPPPKLERPQKPQTSVDDIQLWGSLAIVFAGLASLRTRQPLTTAMNAAASALNGMQQASGERVDQAYKQWEMDTKFAFENFNYEQQVYQDLMSNIDRREGSVEREWNILDKQNEMKFRALAETLRDPIAVQAYEHGGINELVGVFKQREALAEKLKEATIANNKNYAVNKSLEILQSTPEFKNASPQEQMQMIADTVNKINPNKELMTPEQQIAAAKRIIALQEPYPSRGGPYTQADREKIVSIVGQLGGVDATDFPTKQKLKQDLTTGPGSQRIQAMNTLEGHLSTLGELGEKLPKMDFQAAQGIFTTIARQWDPSVTNFDEAKIAVADEFNKVLIAAGAGTGEDRARWIGVFSEAKTPEQLRDAIKTARELVLSRVKSEIQRATNPKYGIKIEDIFTPEQIEFWGGKDALTGRKGQATGESSSKADPSNGTAISLTSREQYNQAPPGTWFKDADGNYRQKPPAKSDAASQ